MSGGATSSTSKACVAMDRCPYCQDVVEPLGRSRWVCTRCGTLLGGGVALGIPEGIAIARDRGGVVVTQTWRGRALPLGAATLVASGSFAPVSLAVDASGSAALRAGIVVAGACAVGLGLASIAQRRRVRVSATEIEASCAPLGRVHRVRRDGSVSTRVAVRDPFADPRRRRGPFAGTYEVRLGFSSASELTVLDGFRSTAEAEHIRTLVDAVLHATA